MRFPIPIRTEKSTGPAKSEKRVSPKRCWELARRTSGRQTGEFGSWELVNTEAHQGNQQEKWNNRVCESDETGGIIRLTSPDTQGRIMSEMPLMGGVCRSAKQGSKGQDQVDAHY